MNALSLGFASAGVQSYHQAIGMDAPGPSQPVTSPAQQAFRSAVLIALLLAARVIVWNHPIPTHGDEVGFIEGIGFPAPYPVHRPGYPLWVAIGGLGTKLGIAPYGAFEVWALAGSVLAPLVLYRWLARLVANGLAWWVAFAFGVNPLMWFLSATALTYTLAIFLALVVIQSCASAIFENDLRAARRAILSLMICSWIRPDYLIWLSPLVVWAVAKRRGHGLIFELICLSVSLAGLALFVSWLYGRNAANHPRVGDAATWLESIYNTSTFRLGLIDGLLRSLAKYLGILAWTFGATMTLLPFAIGWFAFHARPPLRRLVALWTLPLTAFVLVIHMSEPGHLILLVPAGYFLVALWLDAAIRPTYATRIASSLALFSAVQFLVYPWSTQVTGHRKTLNAKIAYLSASGLRQIDHRWDIHTPSDIWPTEMHKPTASRPAFHP